MNKNFDAAKILASKSCEDNEFRERLLANPKETIEQELDVVLDTDHEIHVHEESYTKTHLVLPPRNKFSEAERQAAKTGATSLEFLRADTLRPRTARSSP